MIELKDYGIAKRTIRDLQYTYPELKYMDQLCQLTSRELSRIPGIGKKSIDYLKRFMNQYEAEVKISKTSELDQLRNRVSVLETMVLKLMKETNDG